MNSQEHLLLQVCMQDQLFCTMYGPLTHMHRKYQSPSPVAVWMESLSALHEICESPRPDLMAEEILDGADMCIVATLFYMLVTQEMSSGKDDAELKDELCSLLARSEHWKEFYDMVRSSEAREEAHGRFVAETDYSSKVISSYNNYDADTGVVADLVSAVLEVNNANFSYAVAYLLRRINEQHDGAFSGEIRRLEQAIREENSKSYSMLKQISRQQEDSNRYLKSSATRPNVTIGQNYGPLGNVQNQNFELPIKSQDNPYKQIDNKI